MKRTILGIFILFISLVIFRNTAVAQAIPKWKITDLENFIIKNEKPVIVNFWATYCIPCIEEIPYFEELVKKYEGIDLLLVSLDFEDFYPDRIRKFADRMKFTSPIVWLDEIDADYFCPKIDSSWSGVMPATLLINNQTGYRAFYEEKIPREKLESEIIQLKMKK